VDKATLVRNDLDTEGKVLNALSLARIPASLVDLEYVPQLDEWQLVIATRLYDDKGPQQAYAQVIKALQDQGIYQEVPIRRVFLKSPSDLSVKALEAEVRARTEGGIHILKFCGSNHRDQYSVTFAPYSGPGGAVPSRRFAGRDPLRMFLEDEVGVSRSSVDEALTALERSASIPHVQLTRREAKKFGLA
jgi:hypothetical protein